MNRAVKFLRSTRLSAYLIVILLCIFLLGQIIPQKGLLGGKLLAQWRAESPLMYQVYDFLGFLSIYTSPLTIVVLSLFFLNLFVVMEGRLVLILGRVHRPMPLPPERRRAMTASLKGKGADKFLAGLRSRLGFFRFAREGMTFVAYRNRFGPLGVFLFHVSFFLLLLGGLTIFYTRGKGVVALTEGQVFDGNPQYYKTLKKPLYGGPPFLVFSLEKVEPRMENNRPVDLSAYIDVYKQGEPPTRHEIKVNHPFKRGDLSVLVGKVGVSPLIRFSDKNGIPYEYAYISLDVLNGQTDSYVIQQTPFRFDFRFFPDYAVSDEGIEYSKSRELKNPVFKVSAYDGPWSSFDGILHIGDSVKIKDMVLTIEDLRYWAEFSVVKERGGGVLIIGMAIGFAGLIWRFFFPRTEIHGEIDGETVYLNVRGDVNRDRMAERLSEAIGDMGLTLERRDIGTV